MRPVEELAGLFSSQGAAAYFGEAVSQEVHMLQAGALAEAAGAPDSLIAAALLHDVGHFRGPLSGDDLMAGVDNRHELIGARLLARSFPASVSEPVRLHVAAKRYLCHTEPGYLARLSEASLFTLGVQGGPMTSKQAADFRAEAFSAEAVELRRWDELAKEPDLDPPPFEHFVSLLELLVTSAETS